MGEIKFEALIDSKKAMELLDMAEDKLRKARDEEGLPYYPIAKNKFKYRPSELEKWLRERKKNG